MHSHQSKVCWSGQRCWSFCLKSDSWVLQTILLCCSLQLYYARLRILYFQMFYRSTWGSVCSWVVWRLGNRRRRWRGRFRSWIRWRCRHHPLEKLDIAWNLRHAYSSGRLSSGNEQHIWVGLNWQSRHCNCQQRRDRGHLTYINPTLNARVTANFFVGFNLSFQIEGIGSEIRKRSAISAIIAPARTIVCKSRHVPVKLWS